MYNRKGESNTNPNEKKTTKKFPTFRNTLAQYKLEALATLFSVKNEKDKIKIKQNWYIKIPKQTHSKADI